eukprot:403344980
MESTTQQQQTGEIQTYVLNDLTNIPEPQVPYLSEIWNWQGDTSVLPYKWVEVLNAVAGQGEVYDTKYLKANFLQSKSFDPDAFFFITYRSHAIGLCLAWPSTDNQTFEIKHLSSVPSKRNQGVEEALISLVLSYIKSKGGNKAIVRIGDEKHIQEYQREVVVPILTDKFGFQSQE